jgi:VanZ family protein
MRTLRQWWPAIVWALVIWLFSTELFSAHSTSRIIFPFLKWLFPHAPAKTLLAIHGYIRKAGHVTEYFVLSLLVLRGVRGKASGWRWTWGLATLAMVAGYAALDEVHQLFVPSRGASGADVLLDTAAGGLAQVAAWWRARRPGGPLKENQLEKSAEKS